MGDMNEGPNGEAIELFKQKGIERSCDKALIKNCGSTFPGATSWIPAVFEIDHILGRNIQFQLAKVIKGGGSDHYPVYAKIVVKSKM
jgi:endonuclease/exonuclease/phosphatase family metal-dependent hydrolase